MAYNKRGNIKGTAHEFLSEPKAQDLELTRANCQHGDHCLVEAEMEMALHVAKNPHVLGIKYIQNVIHERTI